MKLIENFILIILIIVCLLLINKYYTNYLIKKEQDLNLITSINDSLIYYKNKENQLVAKISVLETSNLNYFTSLETKNKEIEELQELIKKQNKNLSSATIVKTITKIDTIIKYKEEQNLSKIPFNFNNWVFGEVNFLKDSLNLNLNIKNDLSIIHKKDNKGHYIEIFDKNPYSITESIRSYYKIENKNSKKWSIGPNLSYGINYKGEFLPYIGIGIQYNLIKF